MAESQPRKRPRVGGKEPPTGFKVHVLRWQLKTEVDSFEDLSGIETSTGDAEEAEAIVKQNVETAESGIRRRVDSARVSRIAIEKEV
jgi:hypothetical protein